MIPEPTGRPAVDAFLLWATVATVTISLSAGLWRVVRAIATTIRRVNAFFDDWIGTPGRTGVPATPGVMERVRGIEDRMQAVEHELRPNSGESLRDQVDLANCRLARLSRMLPPGDDHCRQHGEDPPHPPHPLPSVGP